MQIRKAAGREDLARAVAIDAALGTAPPRADYITQVGEAGGLFLAIHQGEVAGFFCLDDRYFFHLPFVSLLIVDVPFRRLGIGSALLRHAEGCAPVVWTSTNRSNAPMQGLLQRIGWRASGQVDGLDPGDPELFFRSA